MVVIWVVSVILFETFDMPPKKETKKTKRKTTGGGRQKAPTAADVAPGAVDSDNEDDEGEEGKDDEDEGNSFSKLVNQHRSSLHYHTIAR